MLDRVQPLRIQAAVVRMRGVLLAAWGRARNDENAILAGVRYQLIADLSSSGETPRRRSRASDTPPARHAADAAGLLF